MPLPTKTDAEDSDNPDFPSASAAEQWKPRAASSRQERPGSGRSPSPRRGQGDSEQRPPLTRRAANPKHPTRQRDSSSDSDAPGADKVEREFEGLGLASPEGG